MSLRYLNVPLQRYAAPALVLLLLGLAVAVRCADLSADPAFHLSKSAGVYFDPFSHSGNARSYVLFGDLHPDQWNTYVYSPLWVLLQVVWFTVFGVNTTVMHAYGAMWSLLAVGCAWLCFRNFGVFTGLLALCFFSLHYIFAQFGRLALLENAGIFFTMLTALTLAEKVTARRAFLCGLCAFVTFTVKATFFYVVPASGVALLVALVQDYLERRSLRHCLKIFGWYLLGTALVFLIWLFFFRIPNHTEISRMGVIWWKSVTPHTISNSINYLINDQLYAKIARHDFLMLPVLIFGGITFYRLLTDWRKAQPIVVFLLLCFIAGSLFVGLLRYKPTRFCTPIIAPLLGLAAFGLSEFFSGAKISPGKKRFSIADVCAVITLSIVFRMLLYLHEDGQKILQLAEFGLFPGQVDSLFGCFLWSALIWSLARIALSYLLPMPLEVPRWVRGAVVAAFVGQFLYGNLSATNRWWNDRHHSIVNASRALAEHSPMVIGGLSVHALVMENKHQAIRIESGWHNDRGAGIFTELGLTHLLLTDYNHLHFSYQHRWKKQMAKLSIEKRFRMCRQVYHLYAFPKTGSD